MCVGRWQAAICARPLAPKAFRHLAPQGGAMNDDDFILRPGCSRSRGAGGHRTFVGEALAAAARAGGLHPGRSSLKGAFGRGRASSLAASRLGARTRSAVIKARVVRHTRGGAPMALHLAYLQRDGVTQDGARGDLFGAQGQDADAKAFVARCADDRHHFRFIVSPDDAERLEDLQAFTRDLMGQAARDLASELDWVAVAHWNTGHPHIHVLVRGKADDGSDLVISRDYISHGLRARAAELVTLELGPRSDLEVRRQLEREASAERWTALDRRLVRDAGAAGELDLRPPRLGKPDADHQIRVTRLRKLQALGLAEAERPGRWRIAPDAEATLRALGRRGDIIARLHNALGGPGGERDPATYLVEDAPPVGLVGRLAARGLDDELSGSGFAVIDGIDGRSHHVVFRELADTSDAPIGGVVELRAVGSRGRSVLAVRSDLSISEQIQADGATWLDRRLLAGGRSDIAEHGFGAEVREALEARAARLAQQGLSPGGGSTAFAPNLLATLRARELAAAQARLAAQFGAPAPTLEPGESVSGVYRRRLDLASGRFAVIEGAMGFSLTPWREAFETRRNQTVDGVAGHGGEVEWRIGRLRGPAR